MPPDSIAARLSLDHLSDFELRKLEHTSDGRPDVRAQFIPPCPVRIIQAMVDADAVIALPLVLAIHRQLTSARREETPLNEAVWKISGPSSARKREAILRKLKRLPDLIVFRADRTPTSHYRVSKGRLWTES